MTEIVCVLTWLIYIVTSRFLALCDNKMIQNRGQKIFHYTEEREMEYKGWNYVICQLQFFNIGKISDSWIWKP